MKKFVIAFGALLPIATMIGIITLPLTQHAAMYDVLLVVGGAAAGALVSVVVSIRATLVPY